MVWVVMMNRLNMILRYGLLLLAVAGAVTATADESFPGQEPSRRVVKLQEKVDALFGQEEYEQALLIYKNELAPMGDKSAQYMVGYMYLAGKGVAKDEIVASAWYRLAAERGNEQFVRIRDKMLSLMNDEQRIRSDQMYVELRLEMGDLTLVASLIRRDISTLRRRMGTERFMQKEIERGNFGNKVREFEEAAERLRTRLTFLYGQMDTDNTITDSERRKYSHLANEAQREIDAHAASR